MDIRELRAIIAKIEALRTLDADEKYLAGVNDALGILQALIKQHEVKIRISKLETELATLKGQLAPDAPLEEKPPGKKRGRKPKQHEVVQAELS